MSRTICCLLFVVLLSVLSGCETFSTVTSHSDIPEENGLMIFRLSTDTPRIGVFRYWEEVKVRSLDEKDYKTYRIKLSKKGNIRSAVYFGTLPAGNYRLEEFFIERYAAMHTITRVTLPEKFGTFTIRSGTITDLGHLIYKQVGRKKSLIARGKSKNDWIRNYILGFYPNLTDYLNVDNMLGWDGSDELTEKIYNTIKSKSKGLIRPYETSEGDVLFGSYLGSVRVWRPQHGIIWVDTGLQGAIESVAEISGNRWIAGSETGRVVISHDKGTSWEDFGKPFINSSVIGLTPYKNKIFATVVKELELSIYYRELDREGWKLLSKHSQTALPMTDDLFSESLHSIAFENKLVTSLPSKGFVITDMDSMASVEKEFPGQIISFTLSNDGVIRCKATKSIIVDPYESHDWGDTWVESKHSRYMSLPYFKDDRHGYAIHGKFLENQLDLAKSTDGGETWKMDEPFPHKISINALDFSHLRATGDIFAWDKNNIIILNMNKGERWIVQ